MRPAPKFARIVVPAPLRDPLIYAVPEPLKDRIAPGARVLIPLQKRIVTGIVLDFLGETPLAQTKEIVDQLDDQPILNQNLLKLAQWISQYYLTSLGEVLATMLPPNSRRQSHKSVVLKRVDLTIADELAKKILGAVNRHRGKLSVETLTKKFAGQSIGRSLARLEKLGALEIQERMPKHRRRGTEPSCAADHEANLAQARFVLTTEQNGAYQTILGRIKAGGFETFLLHGVTGSGKTEVYIRAMERASELGRRSLVLIPEISLTPQLLDRLNARFPNRVGVLHSGLTGAERWAQWRRIARGDVDVVAGARSAVFAPVPELGLIIVDEEHDASYKQEEGMRYNGRDVAVVRGKLLDCPVILGSATPALESYENCRQGRYRLLEITRRVEQRPLPPIEAIDLRTQFNPDSFVGPGKAAPTTNCKDPPDRRLISAPFAQALTANLQAGRQTLIFLNRRGFANFVQCSLCGYVWRCPYCSVTLTLHLKQQRISCHHCNYRRPHTDICPQCQNASLSGIGSGTERVEQALKQLAPRARVARMDRDTTSKRGSHEEIIRRWERGEIDILVGTQMVTKGHDISGVTLVGALLADLSLNLPDFRAAERTFQLLSQVAGRAGRGDSPGRVIVQTYAPDHYAIQHLVAHDYRGFFHSESEFRRALNYPPFGRLVNLRLDGPKLAEVEEKAHVLAAELRELQGRKLKYRDHIEVLGPATAPIEKLRNRYRWQLLLRGKQSAVLLEFARHARDLFPRAPNVRLHIDVDPYSML
ncbi:MAG: replication restart helicase PriA [Candidatus Binatia bacterium]